MKDDVMVCTTAGGQRTPTKMEEHQGTKKAHQIQQELREAEKANKGQREQEVQCRLPTSSHSHVSVLRVARESRASTISPRYERCCERHSNIDLRHCYR